MEKEYKMSAARAQELQEELNYLKTTRSDEVAEQIKVARGFGAVSYTHLDVYKRQELPKSLRDKIVSERTKPQD